MVVVADTSPINYLVLIGQIDLLWLYQRVLVPPAVLLELTHKRAPEAVRTWVSGEPQWLKVLSPSNGLLLPQLDPGESEAIALAIEIGAEVLLIDEQAGRREAVRRGVKVAGTLAVLDEAARGGLVNFAREVAQLRKAGFRISQAVVDEIMLRRSP
jgi:predicted nucleic acid-binding protein